MTTAATRHLSLEFGCEHLVHLPFCRFVEGRHKLLESVALIHVEGEQTAVLGPDVTSQVLQLSPVTVPGSAVTFYESQYVGHEQCDVVRIKIVGIRRFRSEVYG